MAGSSTARGRAADSDAEGQGEAEVEVSDSGVAVRAAEPAPFEPVKLYHRMSDREVTAETQEQYYALKFDGFTDRKPSKSKS